MTQEEIKAITAESDTHKIYDFLVNNIEELTNSQLDEIVESLAEKDHSGQYLASGVKYMNGIDRAKYNSHIEKMTARIIDKDREHRFIGDLILNLYGADYYDHITEFKDDDNFRRMYKRLFPEGAL